MNRHRHRGFTLIEVLVSVAVFAVMAVLASLAVGQTVANADVLTKRMDRLQAVQRTMRFLSNDLSAATPRAIRDELGTSYMPAVMVSAANDFALAVTHGGWSNPAGLPRSTQQRSVYLLDDGKLFRVYYPVLDATYSNQAISTEILDGVESLQFRLMQGNGESTNEWPPQGGGSGAPELARPRAVEIILTLEGEGEIRRLVEVAT